MADVQKEHGFTSIANELLEHIFLFPFSKVDLAVIFLIMRFTYGYQRKQSGISLNLLSKFIKNDRANISRSIQKLIDSKVIKVISSEYGNRPRILQFNKDYDLWDQTRLLLDKDIVQLDASEQKSSVIIDPKGFLKTEDPASPVLSGLQPPVLSGLQPSGLSGQQPCELSDKQPSGLSGLQPLNKEENKMKENSNDSNNIIYLISDDELKKLDDPSTTAAIMKDLDRKLISLFVSCFNYHPNIYEIESIKKEIFFDDRLKPLAVIKIVQDSFHKVATYDIKKRNTNYVLGVIKAIKQEQFLKEEKRKKDEEKRLSSGPINNKSDEYVPGYFKNMYKEAMQNGKNNKSNNDPKTSK